MEGWKRRTNNWDDLDMPFAVSEHVSLPQTRHRPRFYRLDWHLDDLGIVLTPV
jgi:hypothetical protein